MFKVTPMMVIIMISFVVGGMLGRQVRVMAYNKVIEGPKKENISATPTPTRSIAPTPTIN